MAAIRISWSNFPTVAVHIRPVELKAHPSYAAIYASAKLGDVKAAHTLVGRFFNKAVVSAVIDGVIDYVVPVMELGEEGRWNPIPFELARVTAQAIGARVMPLIVRNNFTWPNGTGKLPLLPLDQPSFVGKVLPGRYLLVDDRVTYGSALANLRGWISVNGGQVACATALSAAVFATKLVPNYLTLAHLKIRFNKDRKAFMHKLPFPFDYLTNGEARLIDALPEPDPKRPEATGAADEPAIAYKNNLLTPAVIREFRQDIVATIAALCSAETERLFVLPAEDLPRRSRELDLENCANIL